MVGLQETLILIIIRIFKGRCWLGMVVELRVQQSSLISGGSQDSICKIILEPGRKM